MIYLGSKARTWNKFAPIVLEHIEKAAFYLEPFAGGMNCITNVPNIIPRTAGDLNELTIILWKGLQQGREIPAIICTEEEYKKYRELNRKGYLTQLYEEDLKRYHEVDLFQSVCMAFLASYGGKPFGGYVGNVKSEGKKGVIRDYFNEARNNLIKQVESAIDLSGINFKHADYLSWGELQVFTQPGIVYCDAPIQNTTQLTPVSVFNNAEFWNWCRHVRESGNYIYITAYDAPEDFTCVWSERLTTNLQRSDIKDTQTLYLYV